MKKDLLYKSEIIENALNILNTIPIVGIENASRMVQIFELLKQYTISEQKSKKHKIIIKQEVYNVNRIL